MSVTNFSPNDLVKELMNPLSELYIENLLDIVSALFLDCDYQSAKNSKIIQSFLQKHGGLSKLINERRTKYSDFEYIKTIGSGGFGRVDLVRNQRTRRIHAIKSMKKSYLLDKGVAGIWEEREVMIQSSSCWLLGCSNSFIDRDNIYICMEYMPGGDLLHWLEEMEFDEAVARFYLAEITMALECLHQLGFIHCDIKPENVFLDKEGHIKLADFGSAVRMDETGYHLCNKAVGTPDYLSPEVLSSTGRACKIGPECDWWSVGCVAYEMLYGETPFYDDNRVQLYANIAQHEKSLTFPTDCDPPSPEFENLVRSFLKSADIRLGSRKLAGDVYDASQIKNHPFFASIEWATLRSSTAPIQTNVSSETDTTNLDYDEKSNASLMTTKRTAANYFTCNHLSFAGFTFNRDHSFFKINQLQHQSNVVSTPLGSGDQCSMQVSEVSQDSSKASDESQLKEAQQTLSDRTRELKELRDREHELRKSFDNVNSQVFKIESERDSHIQTIKKLKLELESTSANLESKREELRNFEEERKKLLQKYDELKSEAEKQAVATDNGLSESQQQAADFQREKKEVSHRLSQLMNELSVMRRNHEAQICELNEQYQTTQKFCELYISEVKEKSEALIIANNRIGSLNRDLTTVRASLEAAVEARRTAEDKLIKNELELTSIKSELSLTRETNDKLTQESCDIGALQKELDEMRNQCREAQINNDQLTISLEQQKNKTNLVVDKLLNQANQTKASKQSNKGRGKKSHRDLQSKLDEKEIIITKKQADLDAKDRTIAELIDSGRVMDEKVNEQRMLINQLYAQIDMLSSQAHSTPRSSISSSGSKDEAPTSDQVTNGGGATVNNDQLSADWKAWNRLQELELIGPVHCDTKVRGRRKIAWVAWFAELVPFVLTLYANQVDQKEGVNPLRKINLATILHIRSATKADIQSASQKDLSRTLQLICDQGDLPDQPEVTGGESKRHSIISTSSSNVNQDSMFIHWSGHTFVSIGMLHLTACNVCHRRFTTMAMYECVKCRIHVHSEHVQKKEVLSIQCQNAFITYLRFDSVEDKECWQKRICEMKSKLKQDPLLLDRCVDKGLVNTTIIRQGTVRTASVKLPKTPSASPTHSLRSVGAPPPLDTISIKSNNSLKSSQSMKISAPPKTPGANSNL